MALYIGRNSLQYLPAISKDWKRGCKGTKPSKRPDLCKLDDHHQLYIISIVLDNPTLYLGEIFTASKDVTGTVVVPSTVCKLLGQYGFSRKKIQHIGLQRNLSQRASFIANISCYPKEMLVWVDETGCVK